MFWEQDQSSEDGWSMTTFHYCSVNHQSGTYCTVERECALGPSFFRGSECKTNRTTTHCFSKKDDFCSYSSFILAVKSEWFWDRNGSHLCWNFKMDERKDLLIEALQRIGVLSEHSNVKVEKILEGSLDSIQSPSPSVKIQILGGKVRLRCKCNTPGLSGF